MMTVLLVTGDSMPHLAWKSALNMAGIECTVVTDGHDASRFCLTHALDAVVIDLDLPGGGVLALIDLIVLRNPDIAIIPINNGEVFSDGCLFEVIANARFMITPDTSGTDLAHCLLHCMARPAAGQDAPRLNYA
jgi:hypothetical protein